MDGTVSHRLCFEKQMKTSGGKYGGEKVVAGGKVNAEAAAEPPAKANIAALFGPSVTRPAAPPSPAVVGTKPTPPTPVPTTPVPAKVATPTAPIAVKPVATASVAPPPAPAVKPFPFGATVKQAATAPPALAGSTLAARASLFGKPSAAVPAPTPITKAVPAPASRASPETKSAQPAAQKVGFGGIQSAAQTLSVLKKKSGRAVAAVAATPQELPIPDTPPTPEQLAHLKNVFQELDQEKSGYLSDLVGATKKAGFSIKEETAKKLLAGWSGRFNVDEFVQAILPVLQLENRNWQWVSQLPVNPEEDQGKGESIPGKWKTVRVFLSSTFVDMHGERDCLINEVFPEINNRVKSHYVRVVPVDLRWGVSSEETNSIQSTCLNEIDHCRTKSTCLPWFVGLRGRRLGWVQTKYQPPTDFESPDKLKWVPPFWESETPQSITSMEVYHAFVGATAPTDDIVRSLFVFRQNSFEKDCPENMKWLFDFEYLPKDKEGQLDKEVQHQYAYVPQYSRYSDDYEKLQKQIRDTPFPKAIFNYPCNFKEAKLTGQLPWGKKFGVGSVGALDEFRDFITNTLTDSIQAEFPYPGDLTPQERETAKHSSLIEDRAEGFVGRTELLQKMLDYCQGRVSHHGAMVIVGDPGSGKSALMARFCEMYKALLGPDTKTILISHLVGASEDSESVDKLLCRICEIIGAVVSLREIPEDYESLKKETWEVFVKRAISKGYRVVIVLDAVNQLRPLHNAHSMSWLPAQLPDECKIVISTLEFENNTYANLKNLHLTITEERVTALDSTDRQALVSGLLAKYHKKLTCDFKDTFLGNQMEILLAKEQGTSPLYLVVVCDVLRRFGVYEKLTEYLKSLPGTIPLLFEFVLADLEFQHGKELVRTVTSLLAVSRDGLSESEMLSILNAPHVKKELGETKSNFSQLYGPLRSFFSSGGEGYIRFFHDQLLYVVRARYNLRPGTTESKLIHRFLALYFREVVQDDLAGKVQATASHAYAEIAYHCVHAELLKELRMLFLTLDFDYNRIQLFSIFAFLDDFDLYLNATKDDTIKVLRDALQLATTVLARGPSELILQLYLRLASDVASYPDLRSLVDIRSEAWLKSKAQHPSGLIPVYDTGIVRSGTLLSSMQGANARMITLAPYERGSRLITAQANGLCTIWDVVSGKPLATFDTHKKLTHALILSDASSLLTAGSTLTEPLIYVKIWNLNKPQPTCVALSSKEKLGVPLGFVVNEKRDQAITWHEDSAVAFWNLNTPNSPAHVARHPKFLDIFQRARDSEKIIAERQAARKVARKKKQAARGGAAHSSDESQGDEDDAFNIEYEYVVNSAKLFSQFAVTWSEGPDGMVCLWDSKSAEPLASSETKDDQQGGHALGEEAKNGPCLVTWSQKKIQSWNFNGENLKNIEQSKGASLDMKSIEKVKSHKPHQWIFMTDKAVTIVEFTLPQLGQSSRIELKVMSSFERVKEKGVYSDSSDIVSLPNEEVGYLTTDGLFMIHKIGQDKKFRAKQLTWGPEIDIVAEKKKEKESRGGYDLPQAGACVWNGTHLVVRWSNGIIMLWNPSNDKSTYLSATTSGSDGLELLPKPNTSDLSRAAIWDRNGLISYIDLTHEGVQKKGDNGAATQVIANALPFTYARTVSPMKTSITEAYATKDEKRVVAYDSASGETRVFHLDGLYGVSTLDGGPSVNGSAGLVTDTTFLSSHEAGVCLWDLSTLDVNSDKTFTPTGVHRLFKHRTTKDPGTLVVSHCSALNVGERKLSTAYELPSGVSHLLKHDEDACYGALVGDKQAIFWGDLTVYLWNILNETCVPLKGHTRVVNDVRVSEDCKYALSTSEDNSVRVWNLATHKCTVLMGVHPGGSDAKFFPGDSSRVVTWGAREACLWNLANDSIVSKVLFVPEEVEVKDIELLPGDVLVLNCGKGGSFWYDIKQPKKPFSSYSDVGRVYHLHPNSESKTGGARLAICSANGTSRLYTVEHNEEGEIDPSVVKFFDHNSLCKVAAIPGTLDCLTFGANDNKIICRKTGDGELDWSMTFGYKVESVHVAYDEVHSRIRHLFVQMADGNFALFKPQDVIQTDYASGREALLNSKASSTPDMDADLTALLKSLDKPAEPEMDPELAALLRSLDEPAKPVATPEMDELEALLKSLE